jgi:NADH-quinone oxidoreductase subunit M
MGLLSLAIWMPIVFGVVLLAIGRDDQARTVRWIALIGAIASFLVTLPLLKRPAGLPALTSITTLVWMAFLCGLYC